jgi:phosphoribosylanthranilate isomerase
MRDGENIRVIDGLGIDMMGFIFYHKSPRCVCEMPTYMPQHSKRVGVFVDQEKQTIEMLVDRFGLDYVQLHGNESAEYCGSLQTMGVKVIKAFPIACKKDLRDVYLYESTCEYFLFDTKSKQYGGSGNQFDWTVLNAYSGQTPFLLSGGIHCYSAPALKAFHHPRLAGYDVNSRFEVKPGEKDPERISQFLKELK